MQESRYLANNAQLNVLVSGTLKNIRDDGQGTNIIEFRRACHAKCIAFFLAKEIHTQMIPEGADARGTLNKLILEIYSYLVDAKRGKAEYVTWPNRGLKFKSSQLIAGGAEVVLGADDDDDDDFGALIQNAPPVQDQDA